jgi:ring-1,2-phenylacetyl-CoA epoxidase subunit PaaE
MAAFHTLKIKDITKQTPDCSVITFDMPHNLSQVFDYTQGQHLTLKAIIDGQDTRRSYSICSSMVDSQWQVAVKKNPGRCILQLRK